MTTAINNDIRPEVTRAGALDMQVCVPIDWTDGQIKRFADADNPRGTTFGWTVCKNGKSMRNPCSDRAGFVHVTLDA